MGTASRTEDAEKSQGALLPASGAASPPATMLALLLSLTPPSHLSRLCSGRAREGLVCGMMSRPSAGPPRAAERDLTWKYGL